MEYTGEKLQAMTDDLRERMTRLQRYDAVEEINAYCDNLAADLTLAFNSAFNHLQRLHESMLGEINEYRRSRIEAQQQKAASLPLTNGFTKEIAELDALKAGIPQLCDRSRSYVGIGLKTELRKISEQEAEVRRQTLGGRFMRFKPNRFFDLILDHVGSFEYLEEMQPAGGRIEIRDDIFCSEKYCEKVIKISFMSGDRLVVSTLQDGIFIYRASDLSLLERLPEQAYTFAVLPGERLVTGKSDGELRIYDLSRPHSGVGDRDFIVLDSNRNQNRKALCSLVLLPNGNLASSDVRGRIEVWDLSLAGTDRALLLSMNEELMCGLGVLSNGFLVSCTSSKDTFGVLKLWDLKSTLPLRVAVTSLKYVLNVLVLPDDRVTITGNQGYIAIYNLVSMQPVWTFKLETVQGIVGIACLPNGCLMAGDKHNRFHVWDLCTGKLVQTLHTRLRKEASEIRISPDGKRIAISALDDSLKTSNLEIISYV